MEAQAVRSSTGFVERAGRGHIELCGADVVEYLQGQVTNDVAALEPGQGCYAALLNPKGKILSDCRVLMLSEREIWIDTEPAGAEATLKDLRMYKIGRDVEVTDRTPERTVLSLVGEQAEVAATASGATVPPREHSFTNAKLAGTNVLLVRSAIGCDVIVPSANVAQVRAALVDAGATEVADELAEGLRIELGIPRYGIDMTAENLPGEAGIVDRAVSFTKGCYVGQEPVARMFHKGHPNRVLRGLLLSGAVSPGAALMRDDKQVGTLGSTGSSERHGEIALAIVRREVDAGERLRVEPGEVTATIVELPFR